LLAIKTTKIFLKDLQRVSKRGKNIDALENIINLLQAKIPLPPNKKDHHLIGNWSGHRECHIDPDWLLIYRIDGQHLILERTGSHADLFE
jgi:mRNA interferase YafQ